MAEIWSKTASVSSSFWHNTAASFVKRNCRTASQNCYAKSKMVSSQTDYQLRNRDKTVSIASVYAICDCNARVRSVWPIERLLDDKKFETISTRRNRLAACARSRTFLQRYDRWNETSNRFYDDDNDNDDDNDDNNIYFICCFSFCFSLSSFDSRHSFIHSSRSSWSFRLWPNGWGRISSENMEIVFGTRHAIKTNKSRSTKKKTTTTINHNKRRQIDICQRQQNRDRNGV